MYGLISRIANLAQMLEENAGILNWGGPAVRDLCDLLSFFTQANLDPFSLASFVV